MTNNGKLSVLTALASSGDTWVKLGTLILVAITGLGNFVATKEDGRLTREEAVLAAKEIHELHAQLDDSAQRQKATLEKLDQLLRQQQNR